jgi:hypothetical protein
VRLLVAALRSGQYPQARNRLAILDVGRDTIQGFCCLGVACETAIGNGVGHRIIEYSNIFYYSRPDHPNSSNNPSNRHTLPIGIRDWFGFADTNPTIKVLCSQVPLHQFIHWCEDCRGGNYRNRNEACDNRVEVAATDANDTFRLDLNQIADGFERMYLENADD